jgi:Kef-type K+ transport system membrane component KefB
MRLNPDKISHWLIAVLFLWIIIFLLWGLLVFHFWLNANLHTIETFTALGCALHLAMTPWLYAARATRQNPNGRRVQAAAVVVIWLALETILFFYFVQRNRPSDKSFPTLYVITIAFYVVALIGVVSRRWPRTLFEKEQKPGK